MKISKKRIEAFCTENGIPFPSYEAYGKKVCAYWFGLKEKGPAVKAKLEAFGLKINPDYYSGNPGAGIEATNVSYFKAWHWDE